MSDHFPFILPTKAEAPSGLNSGGGFLYDWGKRVDRGVKEWKKSLRPKPYNFEPIDEVPF